jgi:hypothetical protein
MGAEVSTAPKKGFPSLIVKSVLGIVILALLLVACSSKGTNTASPTPTGHDLTVRVVAQFQGENLDGFPTKSGGCKALGFNSTVAVTVKDDAAKIVGVASFPELGQQEKTDKYPVDNNCVWQTVVKDVPDANFYTVDVAPPTSVPSVFVQGGPYPGDSQNVSAAQLASANWTVTFPA